MDLLAAGSAEAQATLEGVRIGAIVTLVAAVLGQLLAPLLHDLVKRWGDRRAEARAERKAGVRAVQAAAAQVAIVANGQPSNPDGWSAEYRKSALEYSIPVSAITLGRGVDADLALRASLIAMPNRLTQHGPPMHLWTLILGNLVDLNVLIDKPRRYKEVIASMGDYLARDAARVQAEAEADAEAEAAGA